MGAVCRRVLTDWCDPGCDGVWGLLSDLGEARFGASVFWLREGMLPDDMMRMFLETWQTKRDGTKRGILEIKT